MRRVRLADSFSGGRFRSVHAFARRGETEDMSRAVDLLPVRSTEATGTRPRGENLAQVIVPTDLPATLLHDEKNRETFDQNCLESDLS